MVSVPSPSSDPAHLSPANRARAVAAILAAGLLRLRASPTLPQSAPENVTESRANGLAVAGEKSVTVTAG
jgi:hypothetical protein